MTCEAVARHPLVKGQHRLRVGATGTLESPAPYPEIVVEEHGIAGASP